MDAIKLDNHGYIGDSWMLPGGQVIHNVHPPSLCEGDVCCIHNPSDHEMRYWEQRFAGGITYRVDPETGEWVDDPDHIDAMPWGLRIILDGETS